MLPGRLCLARLANRANRPTADILVVSRYKMQANLLRSCLLEGARVGSVDRFQRQQAAAVPISLAASSGDELTRHIEFLFSRNRPNVATSRAVLRGDLRITEIARDPCSTMKLQRHPANAIYIGWTPRQSTAASCLRAQQLAALLTGVLMGSSGI